MCIPYDVTVTVPSQVESSPGAVTAVGHAPDGVSIEVRFPVAGAPVLPVGRAGEIAFDRSDDDDDGLQVQALGKVASRRDVDGDRVYGFLFGGRTRQSLSRLLEPRRDQRVYPDPGEPVVVTLCIDGAEGGIIGPARDVSISGIGIEVAWASEVALCRTTEVEVRVMLPNAPAEIVFEGSIKSRSLGEGSIAYGIQFEGDETDASDPRYQALRAYLRRREADESGPGTLDESIVRRSA